MQVNQNEDGKWVAEHDACFGCTFQSEQWATPEGAMGDLLSRMGRYCTEVTTEIKDAHIEALEWMEENGDTQYNITIMQQLLETIKYRIKYDMENE